jgi:hypothetical protein
MKHSIIRAFVIATVLAAGSTAFAQLSINGYYRVGGAEYIDAKGANSLGLVDRLRLNLSYAAPDDNFGFKARIQSNSNKDGKTSALATLFMDTVTTTASGTAYTSAVKYENIKYAFGYAKFFDGSLKFTAGRVDVTDYAVYESTGNNYRGVVSTESWKVGKYLLGAGDGNITGGVVQLWPIEGLSVAASVVTDNSAPDLHNLGVHAYYLIPDLGKAIFTSQIGSGTDAIAQLTSSFASVGFSYKGFPGLTATAAYRYNNKNSGAIAIVEYAKGPLFANVSADADFTAGHFYTEGEISYAIIPQIKARVYGAYTDSIDYTNTIGLLSGSVGATAPASQYLVGGDLVFPIGKGEVVAGVVYTNNGGVQIPVLVKVNF